QFVEGFPLMLEQLSTDKAAFRPRESLIDIPAEGAFAFIEHLAMLAPGSLADSGVRWAINSIDYFHLTKAGNNVKFLATGRVVPRAFLVEKYQGIRGKPGTKPPYSNLLFRRGLMIALLEDASWYQPFAKLFQEWPAEFFIHSETSPPKLRFWADARKKLQLEMIDMSEDVDPDSPRPGDKVLATLIYRLVKNYLRDRAADMEKIDLERHKVDGKLIWKSLPPEFHKARKKAGESLFLELRSRRDQAFIDHFTHTVFARRQFQTERNFQTLGLALLNDTDNFKTLTLMALSANS
ncbi:MAG: type I-MYXAN CRISPR-associated protein Cmx8, partial [Planctomycetaceae bacterium]|nr:type I-MYXAN CRISPR-associated protein Cmx8 [Planctomycetaceae bacterium]